MEFLSSAKILHQMNYKLFASIGTADFYTEHGIPVSTALVLSFARERALSEDVLNAV